MSWDKAVDAQAAKKLSTYPIGAVWRGFLMERQEAKAARQAELRAKKEAAKKSKNEQKRLRDASD